MNKQTRYQQIKRITLIGVIVNFSLSLMKVIFGIFGYSHALVADGIHSLSDLVTDYIVLLASKAASHAPDDNHPYGHGRIETLATMGLSIILILIAVGIMINAIYHIIHYDYHHSPSVSVIIVAFISLIANEILYRLTYAVGRRIQSNLVISNAWHSRVDALSSLVVLVGVIAARFSLPLMDNLAAIIVAVLIIKVGIDIAWPSAKELVDTGLEITIVDKISLLIKQVSGVLALHQLRTRLIAGVSIVDAHVQVDPWLSVSEGHYIADQVYAKLAQARLNIADVLVHIDAEDDEHRHNSQYLPTRQVIEQQLQQCCHDLPGFNHCQKITLHYLNDGIHVELYLPLAILKQDIAQEINQCYQQRVASITYIASLKLYLSFTEPLKLNKD